jgi:hypothetical protein
MSPSFFGFGPRVMRLTRQSESSTRCGGRQSALDDNAVPVREEYLGLFCPLLRQGGVLHHRRSRGGGGPRGRGATYSARVRLAASSASSRGKRRMPGQRRKHLQILSPTCAKALGSVA